MRVDAHASDGHAARLQGCAGAKRVEVLEIMVSTLTVRVWNGNLAEEGSVEPVLPRKKLYSPIGEENDVQSSEDEDGAQSAPRLYRFFSGEAPPVQVLARSFSVSVRIHDPSFSASASTSFLPLPGPQQGRPACLAARSGGGAPRTSGALRGSHAETCFI